MISRPLPCPHSHDECPAVDRLLDSLKLHQKLRNDEEKLVNDCNYVDINSVLNNYHHTLNYHNSTNDEFEYMFTKLTSESESTSKCELSQCRRYARNRRDRGRTRHARNIRQLYISMHTEDEHKLVSEPDANVDFVDIAKVQILDKIHCHFYHCYDLGYKLTRAESQELQKYQNKSRLEIRSNRLRCLLDLISKRRLVHQHGNDIDGNNDETKPVISNNKFLSNLGLQTNDNVNASQNSTEHNEDTEQKETEIDNDECYSFGVRFYYWPYYKHCDKYDNDHNTGYNYSDWYVAAKHANFKLEMTQNEIQAIGAGQWSIEWTKATKYFNGVYCKQYRAATDAKTHHKYDWNMSHYGIADGSAMEMQHLLSIMLYCAYDRLQWYFSGTFRRDKNESDVQLKNRHSNYHYLARHIREAVEIFGTKVQEGDIKYNAFYHGISSKMMFSTTNAFIFGVLSTTSSQPVAVQFASDCGMVLELYPNAYTRYFSCPWLSDFGAESELLFIGGRHCLVFKNILDTLQIYDYREFIIAMSILDALKAGHFSETDPNIKQKLMLSKEISPAKVGAKSFDDEQMELVDKLLQHEMHRYDSEKYAKCEVIAERAKYIADLLHYICVHTRTVYMNWISLNCSVSEQYFNGYQGYLFLKHYFCRLQLDWINLPFITSLYPNVSLIYVSQLPQIDAAVLDDIFVFLEMKKGKQGQMKLKRIEIKPAAPMNDNVMAQLLEGHQARFRGIGCVLKRHRFADDNVGILVHMK